MVLNVSNVFCRIWALPLWADGLAYFLKRILLRMGLFTDVFHISVIGEGVGFCY